MVVVVLGKSKVSEHSERVRIVGWDVMVPKNDVSARKMLSVLIFVCMPVLCFLATRRKRLRPKHAVDACSLLLCRE